MPIEVWSRGDGETNMDQRILVRLAERVPAHPWWRSRTELVRSLLRRERVLPPARVLDAGCGWGSAWLTRFGVSRTGTSLLAVARRPA